MCNSVKAAFGRPEASILKLTSSTGTETTPAVFKTTSTAFTRLMGRLKPELGGDFQFGIERF